MKLLMIEDDPEARDYLTEGLQRHGHLVDACDNGLAGIDIAQTGSYDVIIADRMLPDLDGLSIVKMLRISGIATPIIFVTTMSDIADRVEGLEAGGDDYLVKPFAFVELLARVHALARRPATMPAATALRVGDLELDLISRRVRRRGEEIDLQPREFKLLHYLMENACRVVTRTMLLQHVWDLHFDPKTNIVETHLSRLRSKIDRNFEQTMIFTIRGTGYILRV